MTSSQVLFTKSEICKMGRLSLPTVDRLLKTKQLKSVKIGKSVRIPESAWLAVTSPKE